MKKNKPFYMLMMSFLIIGCKSSMPELTVVPSVDLNRYQGKWYEIARLPNSFERNLENVTANYKLLSDNKIEVINRGVDINDPTKTKKIEGKAYIPELSEPAKIKVTFFWPFYGDYWILALDNNYQYALVGEPSREYLWILSRTDTLSNEVYQTLTSIASEKGFKVNDLIKVNQQRKDSPHN